MCFLHFGKFHSQCSCSQTLKSYKPMSATKHFESVLRSARHVPNWNLVTSALWPHFLGQCQDHQHYFGIFVGVLPPSRTTPKPKTTSIYILIDLVIWTRNPPIGGVGQNAAPLNFKISTDIQCVITGDLSSNRDRNGRLCAGWTHLTHLRAVLNCSLQPTWSK